MLTFEGNCSANETGYFTPFCDAEQACFNSDCTVTENLLGGEENCRGSVYYGESRFFYRWDGVRKVTPLTENSSTSIYSPYDLADCQGKSITSMTFHNDVDMGGQGIDGKFYIPTEFTQSAQDSDDDRPFSPISTVRTLNGAKSSTDNYTVYNLYIKRLNSETSNAFIQTASGTTTHKNLNFNNCCTVATHKEVSTDAKAYGAIVCCNIDATYTMENVHATECKVFALQKVGTLAARVVGTSTLQNCTVNNCYIENYKWMIPEVFTGSAMSITASATFYPHGEIGGMFGFVQTNENANNVITINNCKVLNTTIDAYGQPDQDAQLSGNSFLTGAAYLAGYYLVPGRHVSTFIGNIRLAATGKVMITNCSTHTGSQCVNSEGNDKHNNTYSYIGQAYYVFGVDATSDSDMSVTIDSNKLTIANCNRYTQR